MQLLQPTAERGDAVVAMNHSKAIDRGIQDVVGDQDSRKLEGCCGRGYVCSCKRRQRGCSKICPMISRFQSMHRKEISCQYLHFLASYVDGSTPSGSASL